MCVCFDETKVDSRFEFKFDSPEELICLVKTLKDAFDFFTYSIEDGKVFMVFDYKYNRHASSISP